MCFTRCVSLSLYSSIHILQICDFEMRNNNFIICSSVHIGYMLRLGGNSGDGSLPLLCYYSGCHFPFKDENNS